MSDSLVFEGEAGKTYEFLALATDVAGNSEVPKPGVNAVSDGADVNLGATPTVPGTTPPTFGQAPAPSPTPSTNELFTQAGAAVPEADPLSAPSAFEAGLGAFTGGAEERRVGKRGVRRCRVG